MRVTLRTRPGAGARTTRRGAAAGAALLLAAGLAVAVTQAAGAQPQPSITQVQATINTLTGQFNKANQQYDQVEEQLTAAKARLKQVNKQMDRAQAKYLAARKLVVQIADSAYEDAGSTSLAGLLTSGDPAQLLAQASLVLQVAGTRNTETRSFLADATEMASVQEEQQRTEQGIAQLAGQMGKTKDHIAALLSKQKSILSSLTGAQLAQVQQGTVNSGGGITSAVYAGPTGTQADTAVAFAFKQLGCAYVYGGTGPCGAGFDCSGLMLKSWAAAGITIPRDTYSQWAALPHIAESALQPGDLLYYNGIGHVAMYVGNGMIIDAPSPGQPVRELSMKDSWYASSFNGAARPLSPRGPRTPDVRACVGAWAQERDLTGPARTWQEPAAGGPAGGSQHHAGQVRARPAGWPPAFHSLSISVILPTVMFRFETQKLIESGPGDAESDRKSRPVGGEEVLLEGTTGLTGPESNMPGATSPRRSRGAPARGAGRAYLHWQALCDVP